MDAEAQAQPRGHSPQLREAHKPEARSKLRSLPVELLHPHPNNPRLYEREDVVASIAADLEADGAMGEEHALTVRPSPEGGYQIISGWHRWLAAQRAGLEEVPCVVVDWDDRKTYIKLLTMNEQDSVGPLEIGRHALHDVEASAGGRGKTGGVAAFARDIHRSRGRVIGMRDAWEVYEKVSHAGQVSPKGMSEKARHLEVIHAADEVLWAVLAEAMVKGKGWSIEDTRKMVRKAGEFTVPEELAFFLPMDAVVARHLTAKDRFSPRTVAQIGKRTLEMMTWLAENAPEKVDGCREWLEEQGDTAWDVRVINAKHGEYMAALMAQRDDVQGWNLGDWRDHLPAVEDRSISLFLTDPPYGIDYQSGHRSKEQRHKAIACDGAAESRAELDALLRAIEPKLAADAHLIVFCHPRMEPTVREAIERAGYALRSYPVWVKNATSMGDLNSTFAPKHERMIHAVKGSPLMFKRLPDVLEADRPAADRHPTEKPVEFLAELIDALTAPGQLVADPFAGVASTLVAAAKCGRAFWGCELDKDYFDVGEERLRN